MSQPLFIVFEGLDGSGSTTQAKLLCEKLKTHNQPVHHTSEPTNRKIGTLLREFLQGQGLLSPEGLQLLFCADRADHLKNEIELDLKQGVSVVCDRYILSTLAFGSLDLDLNWLKNLNLKFRKPDLTFLLQVHPSECIKRIESRGNQKELFEKQEVLEKVWQNYKSLAENENDICIINGERNKEEVASEIWKIVNNKFKI